MSEQKARPALIALALLVACGGTKDDKIATGTAGVAGPRPSEEGMARGKGPPELAFTIPAGDITNHFYRRGGVAAHVLARSGAQPRLLAVFPAGNSGIGLWFEKTGAPATIALDGALAPVEEASGMRGVRAKVVFGAARMRAPGVVLSSVRVLRDYNSDPKLMPVEITDEVVAGPPLVVKRTTLDGGHHFELRVAPEGGARASVDEAGALVLEAAAGATQVSAELTWLLDEQPLTPIDAEQLLTDAAAPRERDRQALAFLTYGEKMLAGSWRFLTYFGRDTLLSTRLLMPVLRPEAVEGALSGVIDRLSPDGEVAHEEDIGEFAALRNQREGRGPSTAPLFDYKMVDDDFMLAPVLAHWMLDTDEGKARAAAFLARKTPLGRTYAEAVLANLDFVYRQAHRFAETPKRDNLVALKKGIPVGDWRDSDNGLGGGRYSYNVNAVLVPAALESTQRLLESGLVGDGATRLPAVKMARTAWAKVPGLFVVHVPRAFAIKRMKTYAAEYGVDPGPAIASLTKEMTFHHLALGGPHSAVPVMHSDVSFAMMFGAPAAEELEIMLDTISRPFPAGLSTPLGLVVANPAMLEDKKRRDQFKPDRYHGAVMWSWQHAMMAAGLARQRQRTDLPAATQARLAETEAALWKLIAATEELSTGETWSWQVKDGRWQVYRLGEYAPDDEATAAQLWSTVYLAVKPPAP
ncbi:MAG TPA: hypothetical protein VMZ28_01800 [Kofleriaceae bacterium]|nr:hypothetical protein [Kofleriaceae bacterium]